MRQRQRSSFPCVAGVGLLTLALLAGLPTVAWTAVNPFVATAADASADLSDALLSLRVRSTLLEKLGREGLRIEVEAEGGQVVLGGQVKKRAFADRAADVARSVPGVQGVDNQIDLAPAAGRKAFERAGERWEARVKDAILETRVKSRLVEELGKAGFPLEVEASDGAVSLSGELPDRARHDTAVQVARKVPGVTKVMDRIETR